MDGPRDCHTKWCKSDTERQIYDIAYVWNLRKGYKWTHLQIRNRITHVEEKFMVTRSNGAINWKIGIDMHTLVYIK